MDESEKLKLALDFLGKNIHYCHITVIITISQKNEHFLSIFSFKNDRVVSGALNENIQPMIELFPHNTKIFVWFGKEVFILLWNLNFIKLT